MFSGIFYSHISHEFEWLGTKDFTFEWSMLMGWLSGLALGWEDHATYSHTR